ncbi:MAG: bifunctional phosphopantothenoylcysteine decarboxylase/phosphopantothenate--cysteine ligase CoaBC [Alphaproteobacteria bacterium]|nr:bifunctional phosphopantothenoylcysteine decarboxylase/phosphopantothenate--cysteine ligase CoaBC [Alphaproteobacteria bacterium]
MLNGKRILLIIAGGIAAYKSLELIRRLQDRGAKVRAILTKAGAEFVTPLSVSSLTREKVYQGLFDLTDEAAIGHIRLSRDADLLVVAPATADLIAKMANGLADDLASTALLATNKPVLIAPAMNPQMWLNGATKRNVAQLIADGVSIVGPNVGAMAEPESGPGRMSEPHEILGAIEAHFAKTSGALAGVKALVTAGPTHEPIDPVRYIANRSSGKQGYAIAEALSELGAETTLVSGPTSIAPPARAKIVRVETAHEMFAACEAALPVDVAVCAAAVADWRVDHAANQKIKKTASGMPQLSLVENPDILHALSTLKAQRPRLVVGFAAETENVVAYAQAKRAKKGCDWIVANDVSPATGIMGGDKNTVHLITASSAEAWPELAKNDVATRLAERIAAHLKGAA